MPEWLRCLFTDCGGSHASDLTHVVPEISGGPVSLLLILAVMTLLVVGGKK